MADNPSVTGGEPHAIGRCVECGRTYPIQTTEDGDVRPVGTGGSCSACGSRQFEVLRTE